jgi:hypothetical protein
MPLPYLIFGFNFTFSGEGYPPTIATAIEYPKHLGVFILRTERQHLISYIGKL